jgi:hypothetical protein
MEPKREHSYREREPAHPPHRWYSRLKYSQSLPLFHLLRRSPRLQPQAHPPRPSRSTDGHDIMR